MVFNEHALSAVCSLCADVHHGALILGFKYKTQQEDTAHLWHIWSNNKLGMAGAENILTPSLSSSLEVMLNVI